MVALFYIAFRKNLQWEFPMVIVRSKRFTHELNTFGKKHDRVLCAFFTLGAGIGLVLMAYSFFYLVEGLLKLGQETLPRITLILPGQEVAGVTFPVINWIIAIGIALAVHEAGHGIASAAERVRPKNVALVMLFGIIPGAGVELDMEQIQKKSALSRMRIMSAGTFMNMITAVILLLAKVPLVEAGQEYVTVQGVLVTGVDAGGPSEGILEPGMLITRINDFDLYSLDSMSLIKQHVFAESETALHTSNGTRSVRTDSNARIGFTGVPQATYSEEPLPQALLWVLDAINWSALVCLGLGVANMMPVWPFDGGYLIKEVLSKIKIDKALVPIYALTLILVLINLFGQHIKAFIL